MPTTKIKTIINNGWPIQCFQCTHKSGYAELELIVLKESYLSLCSPQFKSLPVSTQISLFQLSRALPIPTHIKKSLENQESHLC